MLRLRTPPLVHGLVVTALAACGTPPAAAGAQGPAPAAAIQGSVEPRRALAQPALSPDGAEVAFVSGGDIWAAPAGGGVARLLVSHEATESRPLYSPDGARLAFVSDRGGSDDLYVLDFASGALTRVTWSDAAESLDAWSPDGRWLYFTSAASDIGGMTDVQKVPVAGGTPIVVSGDEGTPEYFAAPSPDGEALALSGRARMGFSQWWRNGHSHIDEAEIWVMRPGERPGDPPAYTRVTEPGSKNLWPVWTDGGRSLVYMSDRSGAENLWLQPVAGGEARPLTRFTAERLLWPSLGNGGRTVVFERDFGIWRLDLPAGEPEPIAITLRGAARGPTVEHLELTADFSGLALSPDGKKVAFVARGDVFAAPAADGGPAQRVTSTVGPEEEVTWSPDSRRVAYTSRRSGTPRVHFFDFGTGEERAVGSGDGAHATPRFSPDGRRMSYVRDGRELVVAELESGRERVLARGQLWKAPFTAARPLAWSPDGRWLAYLATDGRMFTNVHVVPADGSGEGRAVSRLANAFAGSLAWAPDGTALYFDTQHRTEDGQIARIDLVPRTPAFVESRWRALFEEDEAPREPAPSRPQRGPAGRAPAGAPADSVVVRIDFDGIHRRLELLPLGLDAGPLTLSPDGKTVVLEGSAEGQTNLYAFSLDPLADEPPVAKQLTATPGGKGLPHFTPDGKTLYFLEGGRIRSLGVDGQGGKAVAVTAELDVDFDREKLEVFDQGWTYLRDNFHDAAMHGTDWSSVRERFAPYVAGAETRQELERLMNLMVGELNASHLGHSEPTGRSAETGRIGVVLDAAALEAGRHRVAGLVPLGPAQVGGVEVGDHILAVNGETLAPGVSLDRLLDHRVGERVELRVAAEPGGRNARVVVVKPVSTGAENGLRYRGWVERKRAYVHRVSGGRLGYVHMPDMGWGSLRQLIVDLDAENFGREGVVIDLRANRGGFVNAYALDVFARRGYITMEVRGYPTVPARSMLGQRSLEAPTVLVTDLNSLSDAEDFAEGYRTLELGPVVGEPTAGWIIYTWGLRLVDGSSFRIPRSRIRAADGQVMELNPRPVDIRVVRPLGEGFTGRDSQLDAAVRALLGGG
ncbi:MAG TPA: DPP IV N-terminal domain-containing protein [Longimicrobiales bacterium]|nr:DPP IV N-terminal domain-containing protein [Longimicrobiales bacterium]